jgi:hypothetical protein
MPDKNQQTRKPRKRLLDPIDRTSEVLFGLIMALSFTCSLSVSEAGREDVHTMLIGAIGCNVAWGLIDGVVFLMTSLTERARGIATMGEVRKATDPKEARAIISDALPPVVARILSAEDFERIRTGFATLPDLPDYPRLRRDDYLAALGVFLLVFLATFPVVIPFILMRDAGIALRVSNVIALVMLFLAGCSFGTYARYRPIRMGLLMALIGSGLVALTIALGG